jgi:hypothetical protein
MKKAAKVEYGIEIVKPWSQAMYDHNDEVAEVVREKVHAMWQAAYEKAEQDAKEDLAGFQAFNECDWDIFASNKMIAIQRAVNDYGIGIGYAIGQVAEKVEDDIEDAPYYRLKDIAEELGLELEKGFVGF